MSLVLGQLLHLSRSLVGASASVSPSMRTSVTSLTVTAPARLFHLSAPICKDHTKRKNFTILREPPLGPYKLLAPGVQSKWFEKRKGKKNRIGPPGNYSYRVKYPEDGKYTIKKLEIEKLGGRDPVTGRKVIQGESRLLCSRWIYRGASIPLLFLVLQGSAAAARKSSGGSTLCAFPRTGPRMRSSSKRCWASTTTPSGRPASP